MGYLRGSIEGRDISEFDEANQQWIIRIPESFSFISNPGDALNVLRSVVAVSGKTPRALMFDHSKCQSMDLGASAALDVITVSLRQEWSKRGKYGLGGRYPQNERVLAVFLCMGMTKHLQVAGSTPPPELEAIFHRFPLFKGRRQASDRITGGSDQERASSALAEYLNQCFDIAGDCSFTVEGQRHIVLWAGELITNAEEHSEEAGWYAIAYMVPIEARDGSEQTSGICGECQLAIFNFGKSIYESLSGPETPEATRSEIAALVEKQSSRSFFLRPGYSPEDLWTLYALQEGVSRFSPGPGKIDRGKGTVKMIRAFQAFGDTLDKNLEPEMTLVSGTSCIRFTKRYQMREVQFEGGSRQIIAFNDANSLEERPDSGHVYSLPGKFPGTLLSFRFFIDKRYLEGVLHRKAPAEKR